MKSIRIEAIDVFRALIMVLMIFVNDLPGIKEIPHWMEHAAMTEDMLGLSDIVFPTFLFILGMSIPFATQNRINKGDSKPQILKHIAVRSIALLVMGVFSVNSGSVDPALCPYNSKWFTILMVVGFFLIWNIYPKAEGAKKHLFTAMRVAGVVLLLWLAFTYRTTSGESVYMQPRWWGILGLLGWTYLICATVYLFIADKIRANIIFWVLCVATSMGVASGWISKAGVNSVICGHATLHALTMGGVITSLLVRKYMGSEYFRKLFLILTASGAILIIAGFVANRFWIISKIQETPTWLFFCTGIALILYAGIHWLVQIKGKEAWFKIIKPAGTATLTCYLVPYIVYKVLQLLGIHYPQWMTTGLVGICKALLFALVIVGITALLGKAKIKLKI